jgi:hypothetical protein
LVYCALFPHAVLFKHSASVSLVHISLPETYQHSQKLRKFEKYIMTAAMDGSRFGEDAIYGDGSNSAWLVHRYEDTPSIGTV